MVQRDIISTADVKTEAWHIRVFNDIARDQNDTWFTCDQVVSRLDDEYDIAISAEDVARWLAALVTWKILRFELCRSRAADDSRPAWSFTRRLECGNCRRCLNPAT